MTSSVTSSSSSSGCPVIMPMGSVKPLTEKQKARKKINDAKAKAKRDTNVRKLFSSGKYSYGKLATKVGLAKSTVYSIVKEKNSEY